MVEHAEPGDPWRLLMSELAAWGTPVEVAPGRIEVSSDEGIVVTFLVPRDQWHELATPLMGTPDEVETMIASAVQEDDEVFVVIHGGRLVGSVREELPPVRGSATARKVAEYRADHPDAEIGWYAYPPSSDAWES